MALRLAGAAMLIGSTRLAAQDTTRGVRIGLVYTPGTKPGVLVLPVNGEHGDSVRAILQRDFDYGDRVNVVASDSLSLVSDSAEGNRYNYALYAKLGAAALLQATMTGAGLHVVVHDVSQQKVERVKDFVLDGPAQGSEWRLSVHNVADEVELWLTGVRGIAATRILFVDAQGGAKRVWTIDSDGANARPLTPAVAAMSPSWHPRATHFAYASLPDGGVRVVIQEIGGASRTLGGTNSTPIFSPDGATLLYAHHTDSGTDLYAANAFGSDPARRVTVGRGAFDNISPTFSPDGKRIAFTSTKSGHAEVYISDADGTNAEILTQFKFGDQSYQSDPDWSPDGRLIAFQSQVSGDFQIVTLNLRDRSLKRHTSEGVNENPSFAPDSRHVVFTSNRTGVRQLFVIDIESGRVRQLTRAASGARQGAWSPSLRGR
jgi:TolB protein